jgi:hypothetical protein
MAETVYVLCGITSSVCAFLLFRGFMANGVRLLLWAAVCFTGLALNNVLLVVDLVVVPEVDLSIWRSSIALGAMLLLVFGQVSESSR